MADALRIHAPDANPPASPPDALGELLALLRDRLTPAAGLLDREQLADLLRVGVSTLDRLRAAGKVGPRPVQFGGVRFEVREVRAWLLARDPAGELYDAASWPAVWQAMTKGGGRSAAR